MNQIVKFLCALFILFSTSASCKKDSSTSSTTSFDVNYEVIATGNMINSSKIVYTSSPNNVTTEDITTGTTWTKTVKLPKGTLVQLESFLTLSGVGKTSVISIYVNGVKKATSNSVGNTSINNTTLGNATLQWVL